MAENQNQSHSKNKPDVNSKKEHEAGMRSQKDHNNTSKKSDAPQGRGGNLSDEDRRKGGKNSHNT